VPYNSVVFINSYQCRQPAFVANACECKEIDSGIYTSCVRSGWRQLALAAGKRYGAFTATQPNCTELNRFSF